MKSSHIVTTVAILAIAVLIGIFMFDTKSEQPTTQDSINNIGKNITDSVDDISKDIGDTIKKQGEALDPDNTPSEKIGNSLKDAGDALNNN